MKHPYSPLWTALYLPRLSLDVIARLQPLHEAEAVRIAVAAQRRVVDCDDKACASGISPGMTMAAAQALLPDLQFRERNPQAEAQAQRDLAAWALGFTSTVVIPGTDVLLLETAGSVSYFNGLQPLLQRIGTGAADLGFRIRCGTAPTPQGALLIAKGAASDTARCAVEPQKARRLIASLPVSSLQAALPCLGMLCALAINTVGALMAMPRAGVKRRFGDALLNELDRALGDRPDPRVPFKPPERYDSRLELLSEISNSDTLLFLAKRLLDPLGGFLTARRAALSEYTLVFLHERHRRNTSAETRLRIELLSHSDRPAHLLMLLRENLARQALPAPTVEMRLEAHHLVPMEEQPLTLWADPRGVADDRERLIERLSARMGPAAVQRLQELPDHRPERASALVPATTKVPKPEAPDELPLPRPFWLLLKALPLRERGGSPHYGGALRLIRGPECIESGWWDGDAARDYFIAYTQSGAMVWVYRTRPRSAGEQPAWFIHGFFA